MLDLGFASAPPRGVFAGRLSLIDRAIVVVFTEVDEMTTLFATHFGSASTRLVAFALVVALAVAGSAGRAGIWPGRELRFLLGSWNIATSRPPIDSSASPHERLIEMKLPISVRFQGLAVGEIEHLDFEIDGTAAGIRVESFSPATELAADAVSVETINKTIKERSLGATLSGKLPVPVGPVSCDVGPSVSAGMSKSNETSEKVKRVPPKRPVVVSGTFAEGRGVFFKFKQSPQTWFEGVHELVVMFAVPTSWQAGGVRVSATARGHKPRLWMDQPTVFGRSCDGRRALSRGRLHAPQSGDAPTRSSRSGSSTAAGASATCFSPAARGVSGGNVHWAD